MQPGDVVAVYDLGGGTFDAAVLRKTETGFEILGTPEGIEHLGGIDIDEAVFAHVTAAIGEPFTTIDPTDPGAIAAVARLRYDCIEAKEALSSDDECTMHVMLPGVQTEVKITREQLETMVRPWLRDTVAALRRALRSAEVEPADLRAVLLVGGASRMPLVSELVSEDLGRPVSVDAHPKHAVALGTALAADQTAGTGEVRRAPATIVVPPPTPSAAAMRPVDEADEDEDRRGALIVGGAAAGAGVAGTVAAAEVLGVGEAGAAGRGRDSCRGRTSGRAARRGPCGRPDGGRAGRILTGSRAGRILAGSGSQRQPTRPARATVQGRTDGEDCTQATTRGAHRRRRRRRRGRRGRRGRRDERQRQRSGRGHSAAGHGRFNGDDDEHDGDDDGEHDAADGAARSPRHCVARRGRRNGQWGGPARAGRPGESRQRVRVRAGPGW